MTDALIFVEKEFALHAGARLVEISDNLSTKEALIAWYAEKLPLPSYWSCNWDAFTDFLGDLSWIPDQAIEIYHENLPLADNEEDLSIYINILNTTARHWSRFPEHDVRVAFHPRLKAAVSHIVLDEP